MHIAAIKLILLFQEVIHPLYIKRVNIDILKKVNILLVKNYYYNQLNGILLIQKFSIYKIYKVLNNYIFTSNSNTILVSMGDFIRLLLSIKIVLKCLQIYFIGIYISFLVFIEPKILNNNNILYFLFPAKLQGLAGHYNINKRFFNLVVSI